MPVAANHGRASQVGEEEEERGAVHHHSAPEEEEEKNMCEQVLKMFMMYDWDVLLTRVRRLPPEVCIVPSSSSSSASHLSAHKI